MVTLQQFTIRANRPPAWIQSGDNLLSAARTIWDTNFQPFMGSRPVKGEIPFRLFNGFFLLGGFGLECLFKGLRVSQLLESGKSSVVTAKGELIGELKTHDLVKLATQTTILNGLGHNQKELLKRLTVMITWAGRYPVEWKHKGQRQPNFLSGSDWTDIEDIADRIRRKEQEYWPIISQKRKHGRTLIIRQSR
jgi:hypothetical protein